MPTQKRKTNGNIFANGWDTNGSFENLADAGRENMEALVTATSIAAQGFGDPHILLQNREVRGHHFARLLDQEHVGGPVRRDRASATAQLDRIDVRDRKAAPHRRV